MSVLSSFLFLISHFHHVVNVVFFLLGDSPASDFYVQMFRTLSLFHLLNKKNNWGEIARVFIQVKICLERSLGQLEWGRMGRGGGICLSRGTGCRGQWLQVEACSKMI